jgi:hypothetical protein
MNQRLSQINCLIISTIKIVYFAKLFVSFDDSKAQFEWFNRNPLSRNKIFFSGSDSFNVKTCQTTYKIRFHLFRSG